MVQLALFGQQAKTNKEQCYFGLSKAKKCLHKEDKICELLGQAPVEAVEKNKRPQGSQTVLMCVCLVLWPF